MDEGACVFGAGVLLKHRNALAKEIEDVQEGSADTDPVHDARVASRRLRATIPLFADCLPSKKTKKWLKRLKKVTRALGDARDTDVQLAWLRKVYGRLPDPQCKPGVSRLMLRLRQKRETLQAPLSKAMQKLSESGVLDQMEAEFTPLAGQAENVYMYTPALYQHSFQNISGRLDTFLSYEEIIYQPDKVAELHQMRIAAKWLRYTMETFAPLYAEQLKPYLEAVRAVQDLLGEIHDSDVWQAFLPQFLEEERQRTIEYFGRERPFRRFIAGIQYLEQDRQLERSKLYQKFLTSWQGWQAEDLWSNLRRTIQVPFLQPHEIYPPLAAQPVDQTPPQPE